MIGSYRNDPRGGRPTDRGNDPFDDDYQSPDNYVAKIAAGGIAALVKSGSDFDMDFADDCEILRVNGADELVEMGLTLPVYSTSWQGWPGSETSSIPIYAPINRLKSGRWVTQGEPPVLIGKTTGAITAGTTTAYDIWSKHGGAAIYTTVASARTLVGIGTLQFITLTYFGGEWWIEQLEGNESGSAWFKGALSAALPTIGTATVTVDGLVSMSDDAEAPAGEITAQNSMGWVGTDNDPCWVIQNTAVNPVQYELMSVKWEEKPLVRDVFWDAPSASIKQTVQDIITKDVGTPTDENVLTALTHTFLDSMGCSGLQNTWTYETIQYLGQSAGSGSGNCTHTIPPPTYVSLPVVVGLGIAGTQFFATTQTVLVPGIGPSGGFVWHVGTDCSEGTAGDGNGLDAQTASANGNMESYKATIAQSNFYFNNYGY